MANVKFQDGTSIDFEGTPSQQDIEEAYNHAQSLKQEQPIQKSIFPKVGVETGGSSPSDIALSTLQGTGKDLTAIPAHFFNQLGMNYPRYLTEKSGIQYPSDTTSPIANIVAHGAGLAGAIKNPAMKVLGIGPESSLAKNMIGGGLMGAGYASDIKDKPMQIVTGVSIPAVIEGASAIGKVIPSGIQNMANSIVSSSIKRFPKYARYGANPAEAITKEGVTGNSNEDLINNLSKKRSELGKIKGELLSTPENISKTIDASDILNPIDEAINSASEAPETNKELITRLNGAKSDIQNMLKGRSNVKSMNPFQVDAIKQKMSKFTKFTGNPSDDQAFNSAMKRTYGNLMGKVEASVPEIAPLNQRFSNVATAENAMEQGNMFSGKEGDILNFGSRIGKWGALMGLLTGNLPLAGTAAAEYGLSKVAGSPMVKTNLAKSLYGTGQKLENVGNFTSNNLANIFNKLKK